MDVRAFEKSLQLESAALLASAQLREVLRTRREQARDTRNLINHAKKNIESADQDARGLLLHVHANRTAPHR